MPWIVAGSTVANECTWNCLPYLGWLPHRPVTTAILPTLAAMRRTPGDPDLRAELATAGDGKTGGAGPGPDFGGGRFLQARRGSEFSRGGCGGQGCEPLGRGGLGSRPGV